MKIVTIVEQTEGWKPFIEIHRNQQTDEEIIFLYLPRTEGHITQTRIKYRGMQKITEDKQR